MNSEITKEKSPRRLWKILLVVSLGFNLVVVGMVAGALWNGPPERHHADTRALSSLGLRPYVRAMNDAQRASLKARLDKGGAQDLPSRETFRNHIKALSAAVRQVPYDPAAVQAVLAAQRETTGERIILGQTLLLEELAAMSPQDREAFAAALESPRGSRGKFRPRN